MSVPKSQAPPHREYRPGLDGVRALAILGVFVFHVFPGVLEGGFTGVDVFFVLSGFLITANLLGDLRLGRFQLGEFYLRRVQRLLPNALAMSAVTLALWILILPTTPSRAVARHLLWFLGNASNFHILRNVGGYWESSSESSPLTHTWSLAIEEQFYLLLPICLAWAFRRRPRWIGFGILAGVVASFGLGLLASNRWPSAGFYLLPTRAWQLLFGAGLAWILEGAPGTGSSPGSLGSRMRVTSGWLGLAIVLGGFVLLKGSPGYPGLAGLVPTFGATFLLFGASGGEGWLVRFLEWGPVAALGRLSYSIYLWHWPFLTLGRLRAEYLDLDVRSSVAIGGLAGALAGVIAYLCVEQPLRRRGPGRMGRLAFIGAAALSIVLWIPSAARLPGTVDVGGLFDETVYLGFRYDAARPDASSARRSASFFDVSMDEPASPGVALWRDSGVLRRHGSANPEVVVFGSSHATELGAVVDSLCLERGKSVSFLCSHDGTPAFFEPWVSPRMPTRDEAVEYVQARRNRLGEWHPKVLLVADRWDIRPGEPEEVRASLASFLREVSPLVGRVVVVAQVPVCRFGDATNLREYLAWRLRREGVLPRMPPDRNQARRDRIIQAFEEEIRTFPNVELLRIDRRFRLPDGSVRYWNGRNLLYADDDHLSQAGVETIRDLLGDALR